jgi:3-dehydroquinate dehydratase-2
MKKPSNTAKGPILVLNGPNLNLLGTREPKLYGTETLAQINRRLVAAGRAAGRKVQCVQSNFEGELVERVQRAKAEGVTFIILNPAGLTHTSVVLRDALLAVGIPFIEVHLSNIQAREPWRKHSYFSDVARGSIFGLGSLGYDLALDYALQQA